MILYRPVGLEELRLVHDAGMQAFPPRLPEQPIFYPVTNAPYARQIARDWNTKSGSRAGFVTRFEVDDDYVSRFERKVVGAPEHEELWVPAEELAAFNAHLVPRDGVRIVVVDAFFGDGYQGFVPEGSFLAGRDAREQFVALARTRGLDPLAALRAEKTAAFLNFFFWQQASFADEGISDPDRDRTLARWRVAFDPPLGLAAP